MKRAFGKSVVMLTTLFVLLFASYSCNDLFNNPMKDKDTGEDITLLLLDFDFFKTTFTINLVDVQTNEPIIDTILLATANISVGGSDSMYVCTPSGKKNDLYSTENGSLELSIDPVRIPSEADPIELNFRAGNVTGYVSMVTSVSYATDGAKTVTIYMLNEQVNEQDEDAEELEGDIDGDGNVIFGFASNEGFKSAVAIQNVRPYTFGYSVKAENLLKFKNKQGQFIFTSAADIVAKYNADKANFARITVAYLNVNKTNYKNISGDKTMFTLNERVYIRKLILGGQEVGQFNGGTVEALLKWLTDVQATPDYWGWWDIQKSRFINSKTTSFSGFTNLKYTAWAYKVTPCALGANINFKSTAKVMFNLEAAFHDSNNRKIGSAGFGGIFDKTFKLENVSSEPGVIKFTKNYFTYEDIPDIQVANFCNGDINVEVKPKAGYEVYEIALTAYCKDNPAIGLSPTYSAFYKPVNDATAPWQAIKISGGVFRILAKPNTDYQFKLNFDGDYEYINISTDFSKNTAGAETKIDYKGKENGIHKVRISHLFNQSVCNTLGW
jgi:hypothetical protein